MLFCCCFVDGGCGGVVVLLLKSLRQIFVRKIFFNKV